MQDLAVVEYYHELALKGRADEYRAGVAIFNIGFGDIDKFPNQLADAYQLWVYKSGDIQIIDISTVSNCIREVKFYDGH